MNVRADLHAHSCLSPCGDLLMSPDALALAAVRAGIDMIGLTDHNTAEHAPAFERACFRRGICPVFGVEVTTSEEVHVLGLFADAPAAVAFGRVVYASLPATRFDPEKWGDQVIVDDDEVIVDTLTTYLLGASTYTLSEIGALIHDAGGLFIPAHIDRSSFSVWSQLGFLPPDSYDAVEIVGIAGRIAHDGFPAIASSDAHAPEEVGRRSISFEAPTPGFEPLRAALLERRVTLLGVPDERAV